MDIIKKQSPTIPTGWLVDYMVNKGISKKKISGIVGVDCEKSTKVYANLSFINYMNLLSFAASELNNPNLSFDLASNLHPMAFGVAHYIASLSDTVEEFIEAMVINHELISTCFHIELNKGALESELIYRLVLPSEFDNRYDIELALLIFMNIIHVNLGDIYSPKRVEFTFTQPADTSFHHKTFGENCYFEQPLNRILFDNDVLATPLISSNSSLKLQLQSELNHKKSTMMNLVSDVRLYISSSLSIKQADMSTIAAQLNMTERTLTRHLSILGTSFRTLKSDLINEAAKVALRESNTSVYEIALLLGYSETSAFTRMFKIKTGCTPQQYREKVTSEYGLFLN